MHNIYFAHAIVDYNTEYEDFCILTINKRYKNYEVINPKEVNLVEKNIKNITEEAKFKNYFFPLIDTCDLVIAAPAFNHHARKGMFLSGTTREIMYAIKNNKQVLGLFLENGEFKEITKDYFTQLKWSTLG